MSDAQKNYFPWLSVIGAIIFIVVVLFTMGYLYGYRKGADYALDACIDGVSEVGEACKRNMDELEQTCRSKVDELHKVLCDEIPSIQQDRIFKWEVCFIDENCRNCLLMTMEGGSPSGDVEWCFLHAWEEIQPEYNVPDPYIPNYLGPNT